jgi:hypothetical protein
MQLVPSTPPAEAPPKVCAFCKKSAAEVSWLVDGPTVAICDACIALSMEIIGLVDAPQPATALRPALAAGLVGQDAAADTLARLVDRTRALPEGASAPIALLVGPPGTGKSHAVDLLVRHAGLLAVHAHTSRLSAVGYVGEQVGNLLSELAQQGATPDAPCLVALDGIEGLGAAARPEDPRQIDGEEVQLELVTLLDGAPVSDPMGSSRIIDVERVLRLLVATLDPLPPTDAGVRAALVALGVLPAVVARIELVVPFPRRPGAALARLVADLPLTDGARDALLARSASEGAWAVTAARAAWVAHGRPAVVDAMDLGAWGVA